MSDEKVLPPSAGELGKGGEAENYTQNTPSYLDEGKSFWQLSAEPSRCRAARMEHTCKRL